MDKESSIIKISEKYYLEEDLRLWSIFKRFIEYYLFLQNKYYEYSTPKEYIYFDDKDWDSILSRNEKEIDKEEWNFKEFAILVKLFLDRKKLINNTPSQVIRILAENNFSTTGNLKRYITDKPIENLFTGNVKAVLKIKKLKSNLLPFSDYYTTTSRMLNSIIIVGKDNKQILDVNLDGIKKLFKVDSKPDALTIFNVFDDL